MRRLAFSLLLGLLAGPAWGQSLDLDGSTQWLSSANPSVGAAGTVAVWIRPDSHWTATVTGLFDTNPSGIGAVRAFGNGGGAPGIRYDLGGSSTAQSYSLTDDWTGQWHLVSVSWSASSNIKLWVDGVNVASHTSNRAAASSAFVLGRFNTVEYDGRMAHGCLWSRELRADEQQSLHRGMPCSSFGSLVRWYALWEAALPASYVDLAGSGNAATHNGTPAPSSLGPPIFIPGGGQ